MRRCAGHVLVEVIEDVPVPGVLRVGCHRGPERLTGFLKPAVVDQAERQIAERPGTFRFEPHRFARLGQRHGVPALRGKTPDQFEVGIEQGRVNCEQLAQHLLGTTQSRGNAIA